MKIKGLFRLALRKSVLVAVGLSIELISCLAIAGVLDAFSRTQHEWFDLMSFYTRIWLYGILVRLFSLHLFASYKLKQGLLAHSVPWPFVAYLDMMLAVIWAGALSVVFPPAQAPFFRWEFGLPIFLSIFLAAVGVTAIFRAEFLPTNRIAAVDGKTFRSGV